MMMTLSPQSTFGAKVGLPLPRSRSAAVTARRPSTTSVASMTYHLRVMSPLFGWKVVTLDSCRSNRNCQPELRSSGEGAAQGQLLPLLEDPRRPVETRGHVMQPLTP